jgi:hypothetical protein
MFIENPPSGFDLGGLFATHPPIATRIKILEELGGHDPGDAAPPAVQVQDRPIGVPHAKGPWG